MLQESDKDIEAGKLVAHEQLEKSDLNWFKGSKFSDEQKAELDRRSYELEHGFARTCTWEETVALAKQRLKESSRNTNSSLLQHHPAP